MNSIIPFEYSGKEVRVVDVDGDPWWVAKDVCDILGLNNITEALRSLETDELTSVNLNSGGQNRDMKIVNEPGLYSLIFKSRKNEAKTFKWWVTHEVLPQIRKTGSYTPQLPQTFSEALQLAADQARQLEQQKTAVEFYKAVTDSKTAIPMSQVAKVLDMGIGRNKLFAQLRDKGILRANNEPYQDYVDRGWFRVVEQKYTKPDGDTQINIKTLVYQKGIDGIRKIVERNS